MDNNVNTYKTLSDAKKSIENKDKGFSLNPKHKGWCSPITKKTCTGRRKQFALNAKKSHGFRKKAK